VRSISQNEIGGVEVLTETEKEKLDKCIGKTVNEIETPALIVDLDIMERNMDKMMRFLSKGTVGIRPHAKTHKTPPIARMQVEKGAIGITCATIGEAEVLVDGGIKDVLVTNRIVGTGKVRRATSLAKKATLRVSVDSMENVKELALAAQDQGVIIGIVVEVDIGNKRSGVRTEDEAVDIARFAELSSNLRYDGIMGYEGHCVFINDLAEREKCARLAYERLFFYKEALASKGLPPSIVTAGGTGSYLFAGSTEGITDIQAGSYVFMDTRYAGVEGIDFEQSLTVISTIVSHPEEDLYICDAGLKSMSKEFGLVTALPSYGLEVMSMSEEYVRLAPKEDSELSAPHYMVDLDSKYASGTCLGIGRKIHLVPSHCCTTVNLHDFVYGIRKGIVKSIWCVAGRGRSS
jgi:D-serine deaminase-like pyridoxal phosphate-dependent protein